MKTKTTLIPVVLSVCFCAVTAQAGFKAGFARVDVTPPYGVPVPGYFNHRVGSGVLDPIVAECIAVSDGTNTALIYSVDNLHLTNPFFAAAFPAVTAATGVPRDRLFVHSTHSHTAPVDWPRKGYTEEENRLVRLYADFLITRLADSGRMAIADLAPAKIAFAETVCRNISFIRRFRMKDGSVRTNPPTKDIKEPLGTPDETLHVVRFRRDGAPDIAIVSFGTHTDTVGGTLYSADWPGAVRRTFEGGVGGGVKCLVLVAAQGDVNHYDRAPSPGRRALPRKEIHRYMGRAIAGAAMSVWDVCDELPAGRVRGTVASVRVPANLPTADELRWVELFDAGRKDEIPLGHMEIATLTGKNSRVRRLKNGPAHFDILVSSLAIGDGLAFAGLPCEPFVDIGRDIRRKSPFRATLVGCLVNGSEGYIPTTAAHRQGGYEGLSSRFAAPTGDRLVAAQTEQLGALR